MPRIKCCNGCAPPKRTPYCHSTCPDYIAAKAVNDELLQKLRRQSELDSGLYAQRLRNVERAYKGRRKGG